MGHANMPEKAKGIDKVFNHMHDIWNWVLKHGNHGGWPILETVVHELGHNLGLDHTYEREDVMFRSTKKGIFTSVKFSSTDSCMVHQL